MVSATQICIQIKTGFLSKVAIRIALTSTQPHPTLPQPCAEHQTPHIYHFTPPHTDHQPGIHTKNCSIHWAQLGSAIFLLQSSHDWWAIAEAWAQDVPVGMNCESSFWHPVQLYHIDGLVQGCSISSALAMELQHTSHQYSIQNNNHFLN